MKARKLGKWTSVNTSELTVKVNLEHFESWLSQMSNWFLFLRKNLEEANSEYRYLDYKDFTQASDSENYNTIRLCLSELGVMLPIREERSFKTSHIKQDRGRDIRESVENWNEFNTSQAFTSFGLNKFGDSFWVRQENSMVKKV